MASNNTNRRKAQGGRGANWQPQINRLFTRMERELTRGRMEATALITRAAATAARQTARTGKIRPKAAATG
jgi:hypothetical protein